MNTKVKHVLEIQNKRSRWSWSIYYDDIKEANKAAKVFDKRSFIIRLYTEKEV